GCGMRNCVYNPRPCQKVLWRESVSASVKAAMIFRPHWRINMWYPERFFFKRRHTLDGGYAEILQRDFADVLMTPDQGILLLGPCSLGAMSEGELFLAGDPACTAAAASLKLEFPGLPWSILATHALAIRLGGCFAGADAAPSKLAG
ncbi:unnamed protein product, partial [Symbiodinium sp. CCMP2592]